MEYIFQRLDHISASRLAYILEKEEKRNLEKKRETFYIEKYNAGRELVNFVGRLDFINATLPSAACWNHYRKSQSITNTA